MDSNEYIYQSLLEISDFIESIGPTTLSSIRSALTNVSEAVSQLTKNVEFCGSAIADGILIFADIDRLFDLAKSYKKAVDDENKYGIATNKSEIAKSATNIFTTALGWVGRLSELGTPIDYTVLVLNVANQCLDAGSKIITDHIGKIQEVERQVNEALGINDGSNKKEPISNWSELEQQLKDAGASEDEIKALLDALSKLEEALSDAKIDTSELRNGIGEAYTSYTTMQGAYDAANTAAQKYRDSFDENGKYIGDPADNNGDHAGGAAGGANDAEGARVDP